jgi:hypothetical protein
VVGPFEIPMGTVCKKQVPHRRFAAVRNDILSQVIHVEVILSYYGTR